MKVSRPGEFDVMLVFDAHRVTRFFRVEYSREPAGYAKLVFKDHVAGNSGRKLWGEFFTADGKCLSPRKIVGRFYKLVLEAVNATRPAQRRRVSKVMQHGPAVTLTVDGRVDIDLVLSVEVLEWPRCASGWGDHSTHKTWPTKRDVEQIKMKEPKFHMVAKPFPATEGASCMDPQVYWRISFSEAEKTLLRSASSDKKYYRIAKAIFEANKQSLKPLTSYHLKNHFLHHRHQYPRAKSDDSNLGESVVEFFRSLIDHLKRGSLTHFFVSRANLFSEMSTDQRMNVAWKLEYYRSKLVQNPESFLGGLQL